MERPDSASILGFLDRRREEMLDDLKNVVELESPSTEKGLLDDAASFIAGYARRHTSGRVEVVGSATAGDHVKISLDGRTRAGTRKKRPLLLLAHYDTVWPSGTLGEFPFRVEDHPKRGLIARGPGSFDTKAGLVQGLWALRAAEEFSLLNRPVVMICNSDEEVGSRDSRALIEDEARRSAAALVLEPSANGHLKTARKGTGIFDIKVTGRASHAGLDPEMGVNAIEELSRLILDLYAMPMDGGASISVGVVKGGTRRNVVAAEAQAEIDFRVSTKEAAAKLVPAILNLKPHNGKAKIEVRGGINRPPMERNEKIAGIFAVARGLAKELGFEVDERLSGGASDGNFCAAMGVPILDGLGAVGNGAHSRHEHVVVRHMPQRTALVARLLESL